MNKILTAILLATTLATASHASVLDTETQSVAADAVPYDTFHEAGSDFVFVKLPSGWTFVAKDGGPRAHEVFRDEATGFVFVKLSSGWKFVSRSA